MANLGHFGKHQKVMRARHLLETGYCFLVFCLAQVALTSDRRLSIPIWISRPSSASLLVAALAVAAVTGGGNRPTATPRWSRRRLDVVMAAPLEQRQGRDAATHHAPVSAVRTPPLSPEQQT
jgi:hypothetical protein